ncbi:uncharacterized protein DUF1385 [Sinobaca qinghaiensis]|uniref:Uncharacterized protein DUF1385 n=1 Tax=Sinobaca qinghaiensis TaxID=342944 RepID=A0A419V398_9BACL|nr:DUF1385 domain-containing protein [Sinobaca qinghaiensis]RKD72989.1 uncharacterized protein DUF1385 [Sinobaca qinghaiensis]
MKGLSFQKGVMFFGKHYISICICHSDLQRVYVLDNTKINLGKITWILLRSLPAGYQAGLFLLILLLAVRAAGGISLGAWETAGLPFYTVLLIFFGSHFMFPGEWRKFHGAEHKVFSYKGLKTVQNVNEIKKASITNRYCSTNIVVLYFAGFIIFTGLLWIPAGLSSAAAVSAWLNSILAFAGGVWLRGNSRKPLRRWVLRISYWTQKHIACAEPSEKHLTAAVQAYQLLQKKERGYYGNY